MAYADIDVRRVLEATDLVGLVGAQVALKRVGRRWVGLCPFHQERTPSFSVNAEEGLYYCFGCHARGDAITFVRETQGLDFVEALELLADRAHIPLTPVAGPTDRNLRARLVDAYRRLAEWYQEQLSDPLRGEAARSYLAERGITMETARSFGIGLSPYGVAFPVRKLQLSAAECEEGGLAYRDARGALVDHMHGRVVFPIRDTSSRVVAFGGRILPRDLERLEGRAPKYKNSPESPLYRKRRTLYHLDRARSAVVERGEAIVCEGYTDVIALVGIGITNVVATCGTALSEEHLEVLRRFAERVVLLFDGDAAGLAAAERLVELPQERLTLEVATLEGALDPADAARRDPELVHKALVGAVPLLRFVVERRLAQRSLATPEARAQAVDEMLELIGRHPNALVRGEYVALVADRTGFGVSELLRRMRTGRHPQEAPGASPVIDVLDVPSREALRLLVHDPASYEGILVRELFRDPRAARLVELASGVDSAFSLRRRLEGVAGVEELYFALASEPPEASAADVIATLVVREARFELERIVRSLRERTGALERALEEVPRVKHAIAKLAEEREDLETLGWLIGWVISVRRPGGVGE
jgi:DNA primase